MPPPGGKPAPPGSGAATLIGKRYVDEADTVELLCTSSGAGELPAMARPWR